MDAGTLISAYILAGGLALGNGGYIEAGVGVAPSINKPEVHLNTPVFDGEIGKQFGNVSIYARHSSGILQTETGGGFNLIGVKYRWK